LSPENASLIKQVYLFGKKNNNNNNETLCNSRRHKKPTRANKRKTIKRNINALVLFD